MPTTSILVDKSEKATSRDSSAHVTFSKEEPETHLIPRSMRTWRNEEPPVDPSKEAKAWAAKQMFFAEAGKVKEYDPFGQEEAIVETDGENRDRT